MGWIPGQVEREKVLQAPRPDVPDDLLVPLFEWLERQLRKDKELFFRLKLWMQDDAIPDPRGAGSGATNAIDRVWRLVRMEPTLVLDLIHHVLCDPRSHVNTDSLQDLLTTGNSLYKVCGTTHDGLEERLPQTVVLQVQQAVADADKDASEHLIEAWNSAYGYAKNPAHSFGEAIRAAEVALRPVVSPKDHATIFKMIKTVSDKPEKWKYVLSDARPTVPPDAPPADGVQVVLDLMRLLAYGQRKRHGGSGEVTEAEAKNAVMVAVAIVQLCGSGAFSVA